MTGVEITADSESASPTTDRPPLRAGDVMSTRLLAVDGEDGLLLAWELISQAGVHHLPVIGNGRCLGLVAERDLAVEVARDPLGHLERIYRKLGVNDRASAVRIALTTGLLGRNETTRGN